MGKPKRVSRMFLPPQGLLPGGSGGLRSAGRREGAVGVPGSESRVLGLPPRLGGGRDSQLKFTFATSGVECVALPEGPLPGAVIATERLYPGAGQGSRRLNLPRDNAARYQIREMRRAGWRGSDATRPDRT